MNQWNYWEGKKNLVVVLTFKWCLDYFGEQDIENGLVRLKQGEIATFMEDLKQGFIACNYEQEKIKELNNRIKEAIQHGPKLLLLLRILYPWISFDELANLKIWYHTRRASMEFFQKVCVPILIRLRDLNSGLQRFNLEQHSFFSTFEFDFALSSYLGVETSWNPNVDKELRNAAPLSNEQLNAFENRIGIIPRPVATMYSNIEVWEINEDAGEELNSDTDAEMDS
jgi:hypothetical protein